jgi:hypothetical protein
MVQYQDWIFSCSQILAALQWIGLNYFASSPLLSPSYILNIMIEYTHILSLEDRILFTRQLSLTCSKSEQANHLNHSILHKVNESGT